MENSSDPMRNQTRGLSACSAVPEPTELPYTTEACICKSIPRDVDRVFVMCVCVYEEIHLALLALFVIDIF
jgi:hypothetical protein